MEFDPTTQLRSRKLRATPHRIALWEALSKKHAPATAEDMHREVDADLVTIYRNLQSLVAAGLVREVRFKDTTVRYEIVHGGHHHHIVCTGCGVVDELPECTITSLEKPVLQASEKFVSIDEHSLEFFGTCRACASLI